jgi:ABC-type phosphate transport system permease subunit
MHGGTQDHSEKRQTNMKTNCFHGVPSVIAVVLGLSIGAAEFYSVRELVAALIIFSILFGTMGMALLSLFLIQDLALKGVAHLESRMAYVRIRHGAISGQRDQNHVLRSPRWN